MPNLSWNEIRARATAFSREWSSATREQADKQTFWNEFFEVFGIPRRTVASFEEPVRNLHGTYSFIDLFWKGKLLVEHKTAGQSLEAAETQAFDYIQGLLIQRRGDEVPRYVLLSDFQRFALYDLEPDDQRELPLFRDRFRYDRIEFPLADLQHHVRVFAFIPGYQVATFKPHDQLNLKAVGIMASVHDTLKRGGYAGHDLERFLVRILFCLFAQNTGIFDPESFRLYIENRTHPDGNDLGARLAELFNILDTEESRRQRNTDETLLAFPYVNGALFKERLDFAAFTGPMRKAVLEAANFDWSRISPAIFGALFQEVMQPEERRKIGAHYTSERDILKVIHPLFLDSLRAEFETIQKDRSGRRTSRLEDLRVHLTKLKFLDPACGCGNFLVVAYRELRALELDILRAQHSSQQAFSLDEVSRLSQVDVHQFYGIEIEEWPARIAEVALWLMDHQCNLHILAAFSQPFLRLPLKQSPHIHHGNALRMDWNDLLPASECSYILGNPPFVGKSLMSEGQKYDMQLVIREVGGIPGSGVLDYVTAWYIRAAVYIKRNDIEVAFVSTNSISQGEQPGILWGYLFRIFQMIINFAYQTFEWTSEARGKAHVHVAIIGFGIRPHTDKRLYANPTSIQPTDYEIVSNISPYLMAASNSVLIKRSIPLGHVPKIMFGNMPNDGGNLLLTKTERKELLAAEPAAQPFIKAFIGADEMLNGNERSCLWLKDISPKMLSELPLVRQRVIAVQRYRKDSKRAATRLLSASPTLFGEIRQPISKYICFPRHSSETRDYIPLAFFPPEVIIHDSCCSLEGANNFHFGVLTSSMHMSWVKIVAGRLKSDFRYSNTLVYNNYPWPQMPTPTQTAKVEELAQDVLDARALYPDSTLAQLYDPLLMPAELVQAHHKLDRAVERCYRPEPFQSDRERVEFLFALYEQLTAPLLPPIDAPRRRRSRASQPDANQIQ